MDRNPAVAGSFYPARADTLRATVQQLLHEAASNNSTISGGLRALAVPHAGYHYSGLVAAWGWNQLTRLSATVKTIVLLGPAHRVAVHGAVADAVDRYLTPLGAVTVDGELRAQLLAHRLIGCNRQAHGEEHSIEVHLPFLQSRRPDLQILPVVVGDCTADDLFPLLECLLDNSSCLPVVSTDLSHFLTATKAEAMDKRTLDALLHGDLMPLQQENSACGRLPLSALARAAIAAGLHARLLTYRHSGAVGGDQNRVVGYASMVWEEN